MQIDRESLARAMLSIPAMPLVTRRAAMIDAILADIEAQGFVLVPKEPSQGLLASMAIRHDHGLGVKGYYDQQVFGASGCSHAERMISTMASMRQLHEEVTGSGFYSPEREEHYAAMIDAAKEAG